ncbi:DUF2829 domain-containing protein [Acinetobacter corruptisaponis]|uniref:DUF2829 domain-containing protein n=1 Tax=Acinetobacter corruptisaponis TaxID=3045147 RepID=A0ABY8S2K3_9GAMM|nr:DUF2829 domain-containing protein [Acinetobacter sp. KCTC 92772]WHP05785.1 DUF2829 domain-containing protein [Acinetobacter sp. KCTC 92772]
MTKAIALGLMTAFIGTKTVLATPMNREDYDNYRGLPVTPLVESDGYLVEYTDGGKSNHPNHKGFISWSPKSVFENAYRQNGALTFGDAIYALKQGKKVTRSGWDGGNQYVVAQAQTTSTDASKIWNPHNKAHAEKLGGSIDVAPYCTLKTAQDTLAMGWTPDTSDLFAEDWVILE